VVDMVDHSLPVEGLLLCIGEALSFPIHLLQFRRQFLATELEFTQRDGLCLIGIKQALTLPFKAQAALLQVCLLSAEGGHILLFRLRPGLVEVGKDGGVTK